MHVIAGFESQIAARGGALTIIDAARARRLEVRGAALARRDTERAVHIDPLRGFPMPEHIMQALDNVVDETAGAARLHPGEAALVVAITDVSGTAMDSLLDDALLCRLGALWVDVKPPQGRLRRTGD